MLCGSDVVSDHTTVVPACTVTCAGKKELSETSPGSPAKAPARKVTPRGGATAARTRRASAESPLLLRLRGGVEGGLVGGRPGRGDDVDDTHHAGMEETDEAVVTRGRRAATWMVADETGTGREPIRPVL